MSIFEFALKGPPVGVNAKEHSTTSRRKYRDWMARVAAAAKRDLEADWQPTQSQSVVVSIFNYHASGYHDVDNLIKPIFDAMNGIVYEDDKQVHKVISQRIDNSGKISVDDPSAVLAEAFEAFSEFVHVIVSWEAEG